MTHPITPPPELVQQWLEQLYGSPVSVLSQSDQRVITSVAQWGADQELEACCAWLPQMSPWSGKDLRKHRRPKPPSLKEQALEAMHRNWNPHNNDDFDTIRRALEALPND